MKPKIVIISLIGVFLGGCVDNAPPKKSEKAKHKQKEDIWKTPELVKDTIYLLWEKKKIPYEYFFQPEKQEYYDNKPYYSEEDKGWVFQLSENDYVIFEDGSVSDKQKIKHLQAYKFHTIDEINFLDKKWQDKNELIIKKSVSLIKRFYYWTYSSRNSMFVIYLIKKDEDNKNFTIYPVSWYYPPEIQM